MARVAIVTGGTRGIGEAISLALKDAGMTVAANYAGNDERAREFSERTGIAAFKWDVGDFDACASSTRWMMRAIVLSLATRVISTCNSPFALTLPA